MERPRSSRQTTASLNKCQWLPHWIKMLCADILNGSSVSNVSQPKPSYALIYQSNRSSTQLTLKHRRKIPLELQIQYQNYICLTDSTEPFWPFCALPCMGILIQRDSVTLGGTVSLTSSNVWARLHGNWSSGSEASGSLGVSLK